jgi:hypothetical protein
VSVTKPKTKGKIAYRIAYNKSDGSDTESDGSIQLSSEVEAARPPSSPLLELLRKRSIVG